MLHRPIELAQYTSAQLAALADDLGVRLSVGRKGQCWDPIRVPHEGCATSSPLVDARTTITSPASSTTSVESFENTTTTNIAI